MEEPRHMMIPYIVHESAMARAERTARRQWIAIIILIILLMTTNALWIIKDNAEAPTDEVMMDDDQ